MTKKHDLVDVVITFLVIVHAQVELGSRFTNDTDRKPNFWGHIPNRLTALVHWLSSSLTNSPSRRDPSLGVSAPLLQLHSVVGP